MPLPTDFGKVRAWPFLARRQPTIGGYVTSASRRTARLLGRIVGRPGTRTVGRLRHCASPRVGWSTRTEQAEGAQMTKMDRGGRF
ncbi:hypothetical protein [Brucella grignonensis]|uniref:hypothetical protein n=1 Tax=Brucella grignonensis TaxID=94627 RepID=UPI00113FF6D2|nr:hypothetical protein [Brucella grignonensis]